MAGFVGEYWKWVAKRTFKDTLDIFASNPRKAIWAVFFTLVAALGWGIFVEKEGGFRKALWFCFPLIVYFAAFSIAYLIRFVMTPAVLHKEFVRDRDKQIDDLRTSHNRIAADLDSMKSAVSVGERSLKAETQRRLEEVERARSHDPRKNAMRGEIKDRIAILESVIRRCKNKDKGALEQFQGVDHRTQVYLQQELPSYRQYGQKYPVQSTYTNPQHMSDRDFDLLTEKAQDRINSLNEVLSILG